MLSYANQPLALALYLIEIKLISFFLKADVYQNVKPIQDESV